MQPEPRPARVLRAKIDLLNSSQYDHWEKNELPKLRSKYPKFNFVRLVDTSTDKNYITYRTR